LHKWTGDPEEEAPYDLDFKASRGWDVSVDATPLFHGEAGSESSLDLHLHAKSSRRYEIDQ
jgi:hypothetical protein